MSDDEVLDVLGGMPSVYPYKCDINGSMVIVHSDGRLEGDVKELQEALEGLKGPPDAMGVYPILAALFVRILKQENYTCQESLSPLQLN